MKPSAALCVSCLYLLAATPAGAEPFAILPDRSLVFNVSFSTEGTFTCTTVTPCTGSGTNAVTFGSGPGAVTVTFTGVSTTVAAGNTTIPVSLGTFQASSADPAFAWPTVTNPNNPVLLFQLSMEQSSPVGATGLFPATFGPDGGTDLPLLLSRSNYLAFPTGQNPPGFQYNHLVYTLSPFPFSIRGQGLTDLTADVGAVPEPATLVFVGTGLLLGAAGRRRTTRSGRG